MDGLHRIFQWRPVKHCVSAAVSARRVCDDNAVPGWPVVIDSARHLFFLEICPGPYWSVTYLSMPTPFHRSGRYEYCRPQILSAPSPTYTPSTHAHPLPTCVFSSSSSDACPVCTGPSLSPFPVPFRPHCPALSVPVPVPFPIIPSHSLLCSVHLSMEHYVAP